MKSLLFLLFINCFFSGTPHATERGTLIISVGNVRSAEGILWVGIYNSQKNFMVREKAIIEGFKVEKTGVANLQIPNLQFGNYAIAIFHDVNENGELDKNALGIPVESFAFSKKPVSRFRMPKYKEVNFNFQKSGQTLTTMLKKWWE